MGWSIGFDSSWDRDIGYSVPASCDNPDCKEEIDRGLSYVCGGDPYGGDHGCGLYFCSEHLWYENKDDRVIQLCDRCHKNEDPYEPKPDILQWVGWKLQHESWQEWREDNPDEVAEMQRRWDIEPRGEEFMTEFAELY